MAKIPNTMWWLTGSSLYSVKWEKVNGPIISSKEPSIDWKKALQMIPDLKGQIVGGHTIIWDHKIRFTKIAHPILSSRGYTISEAAMMRIDCSCGWFLDDCLQSVTKKQKAKYMFGINRKGYPEQETVIDFKMLEQIIFSHIPKPHKMVEMEYIKFSAEWLEGLKPEFLNHFLSVILTNGGILHFEGDTREYFLIDDQMTDKGITELKEMLEGHPIETKKIKVIRNG